MAAVRAPDCRRGEDERRPVRATHSPILSRCIRPRGTLRGRAHKAGALHANAAAQAAKEPFLELEIERSPATFSDEDDVVVVAATVVAGFCGPLVGGQVVWAAGTYQPIGASTRFFSLPGLMGPPDQ